MDRIESPSLLSAGSSREVFGRRRAPDPVPQTQPAAGREMGVHAVTHLGLAALPHLALDHQLDARDVGDRRLATLARQAEIAPGGGDEPV